MRSDLSIRADAFNKVKARYGGREFEWGKVDCIKVARYLALEMGHKPPKMPRYSTQLGAIRAIKKMGFDSVEGLIASFFPKIPVAKALLADLIVVPGEEGLDAVLISAGRWIYGFHEESDVLEFIISKNTGTAYRL